MKRMRNAGIKAGIPDPVTGELVPFLYLPRIADLPARWRWFSTAENAAGACNQVAPASAGYFASRTTSKPTLASTCFSASCNTRIFSSVEPPLALPKTQAASLPLYNAG
jgi:hypothetical protein